MINDGIAPFLGKVIVIYNMDNILIYSKIQEEHTEHLRQVLSLLRDSKLYAKLSKCDFLKHEIDFLGHGVSADGVKVDPRKHESVQNAAAY